MLESVQSYQPVTGVDLKVTNECFLQCNFCVNRDGPQNKSDVDPKKAIRALLQWRNAPDELGKVERVFFTGGETLMRIGLVEEIAKALPPGVYTSVVTNGILLNERMVERLKNIHLSRIKVSYDTPVAKDLVTIRQGTKESHLDLIDRNIEHAVRSGMLVYMRVALGQFNAGVLNDIYRKATDLGIDTLQIKPIVPSGRADEYKDSVCLSPLELLRAFEGLASIYDGTQTAISVSCFPPAKRFGLPVKSCSNNQKFYFEVNGDIYTCNYITDPSNYLGNYHEENGVLEALKERRRRYDMLFNVNRVISNCPSLQNYEAL